MAMMAIMITRLMLKGSNGDDDEDDDVDNDNNNNNNIIIINNNLQWHLHSGTSIEHLHWSLDLMRIWKCWFLRRGENRSTRRKPLRAESGTNNKHNPHMASSPEIAPKPHRWEASALTVRHHCAIAAPYDVHKDDNDNDNDVDNDNSADIDDDNDNDDDKGNNDENNDYDHDSNKADVDGCNGDNDDDESE